ncbi:hypothetical protein J5N97_022421 [Dioscorea zingiberensis]|uniref:Mediator complex subunit 15 KIX domain-containing protein n=1 Tax=Dioscorea zingiberensis TaxID=325984 RepID=A0A9D5HAM9_9LILI|nr:hypothetical protein J5N97_022421 [Dioscorea zingiberensis]
MLPMKIKTQNPQAINPSSMNPAVGGFVDWQEEIYQKIKTMKELYFAELNELYQKVALKFQQCCENKNLLPHAKQSEQIEKMKNFKVMLERSISFLQISKSSIQPGLKEKLPLYQKQISTFLTSNRKPRNIPPQSQFQPPGGKAQSMPQQQPSQPSQLQPHDGHVNQVQQMNLQGSVTSMQQASASTSLDSTAQTGNVGVVDWQEEIYQKIKAMKELYFAELNELYRKVALKFQQCCENRNLLPHANQSQQIENMKNFKVMLERSISFLQISKSSIQPGLKEKLPLYEKQISTFLASKKKTK